jgi:UDP-N-acetylmuramate dehydrogenase
MPPITVREHVPLAPLSTLGIGGPARFYARATDRDAIEAGVAWARARGVPLFVLGGGSNVVLADEGYPGLVLHVVPEGVETQIRDGRAFVRAGPASNASRGSPGSWGPRPSRTSAPTART